MEIIGHKRQIEYLEKVFKRGRGSHAYLFYGPEGIGKFTYALEIAKSLFCLKNKSGELLGACNVCASCLSVDSGSHPDFILLDTEHTLVSKKEERKDIPIDDIRELKRRFSFLSAGWRIAVINEAEKLGDEAANAFLKILEEPGEKTLFILVSSFHEFLLPTIFSRTQAIRFSLVPDIELRLFLEGKRAGHDRIDTVMSIVAGRPGMALRLLEDSKFLSAEQKLRQEVGEALRQRDFGGAFAVSERVSREKNRKNYSAFAGAVLGILRSNLHATAISGRIPKDSITRIKEIHRILSILDTTNVNPRLALDAIWIEGMEAYVRK